MLSRVVSFSSNLTGFILFPTVTLLAVCYPDFSCWFNAQYLPNQTIKVL